MKIGFTILLNMLCLLVLGQQAVIEGRIRSDKGSIVAGVTVTLDNKEAISVDDQGYYRFSAVEAGRHQVTVSHLEYTSNSVTLTIKAGELRNLDFVLESNTNMIHEVVVQGRKRITEQQVSPSLRVETPVLEIAQNIQILNADLLSKQQMFNLSDGAFRNISGVSRNTHWNDLYVNVVMRGSQIQAFRNGMNVVASFWGPLSEDMAVVERMEFLKGPAGFMMSSGDPAGIYNVVTKKPTGVNKAEVTFSLGSFDTYRSTLDLDGKLSKNGKLLYRLNIAGTSKGSFRPFEDNKRLLIAPVLSYQVDDRTKVTFEYTYQRAKMTDIGSAYLMSPFGYKSLDRKATLSDPTNEPANINEHSTYLHFEHRLSDQWKFTAQGTYIRYDQVGASSWPSDILADGKVIRKSDIWDAQSDILVGQLFLNGNVKTGAVQHRMLTGLDIGQKNYMADWNQSIVLDTINGGEFDPQNPKYGYDNGNNGFDRSVKLGQRQGINGGVIKSSYNSVYLQDELGFLEGSLRLTLAGRFTQMTMATWGGDPITSRKITPRVSLSYSINPHTTVYALYDQAFLPQRSGVLHNGGKIQPITGNNLEIGIKRDWANGKWNTTLSYYQITKNHEITSYGPNRDMMAEIGQKKINGIEFDLKGELAPGLQMVANYAYTNGKITKVNEGVDVFKVGQRLNGSDKHIANLWLNYEFWNGPLKGWSANIGGYSNMDRATAFYSEEFKERNIGDYWRMDAGIGYHKNKFEIHLLVQNLADTYLIDGGSYYDNYFSRPVYSWQAGAPRNYKLTVGYKF